MCHYSFDMGAHKSRVRAQGRREGLRAALQAFESVCGEECEFDSGLWPCEQQGKPRGSGCPQHLAIRALIDAEGEGE